MVSYHLLIDRQNLTINPSFYQNTSFEPLKFRADKRCSLHSVDPGGSSHV